MNKFNNFRYKRPNFNYLSKKLRNLVKDFDTASSFSAQEEIFLKFEKLQNKISSLYAIASIRHTCNTKDSFYESENDYFDEMNPQLESFSNQLNCKLLASPFREDFAKKYGEQFFVLIEKANKTFNDSIVADLQEENRLNSEHTKLVAQAEISFEGKIYNLSTIDVFQESLDRSVRKAAAEAGTGWYQNNQGQLADLYDRMVKLRHSIAQKLGYKNFVQLGYDRLGRSDYGPEDISDFRELVRENVVPLAKTLVEKQRKRLGLDSFKYYDQSLLFPSGNPKLVNDVLENSKVMFSELSKETKKFFKLMVKRDLMDLEARDGKATGGYCTFINNQKLPFIFSNFNGTSDDIDVMTHEAGHAFQIYTTSQNVALSDYYWPTMEACEIHSMSMEFLTWPWMNLFFDNADKYKFSHLSSCVMFLPYCVSVDEFQHFVYENPECSKQERNEAWKEIESKYMPYLDWDGNSHLESGGFWLEKSHIFSSPFYYIDYGLAQICAFQFWSKKASWQDYLNLCKAGGSQSFLNLLKIGNLDSPFDEFKFPKIIQEVENWLNSVDDLNI